MWRRVEELERKVEEAQKAAEEVQMRARVEVSAMEFSLKQEGQRLREALQKAHDLKKRLIHAYAVRHALSNFFA